MENNNNNYSSHPNSRDSSPRSRSDVIDTTTNNDTNNHHHSSFDEPPPPPPSAAACKVKLMCSYGGKIQPRPHDNNLTYVSGDTKILAVDRFIKLPAFIAKLTSLTNSSDFCLKYQLPGEDLDALVSVTNDEDLDHMMVEYDRLSRASPRPARLRLFLFPLNNSTNNSSSFSYSSSAPTTAEPKPQWFVEALNSVQVQNREASPPPAPLPPLPPPAANPDFLFGLDNAHPVAPKPADLPDNAAAVTECGPEAVRETEIQELSKNEQLVVQRKKDDVAAPLITHATAQVHSGPVQFHGNGYPLVLSGPGADPGPVYLIQTPSGMYQAVRPVTGPAGQPIYFIQTPQPVPERGYSQITYVPEGSALRRQATAAPGGDGWN
ncbi:uncharacterized protein LOC130734116 [Lotus japonicus]|uniref:uncharacterized protein LOC130734116 n=1 Tax=Lotus japonicus TaxID=34305 RepID=UPI0025877D8C|nr:uncharacterized protein LOC130734116 [Lotus japonicus]